MTGRSPRGVPLRRNTFRYVPSSIKQHIEKASKKKVQVDLRQKPAGTACFEAARPTEAKSHVLTGYTLIIRHRIKHEKRSCKDFQESRADIVYLTMWELPVPQVKSAILTQTQRAPAGKS